MRKNKSIHYTASYDWMLLASFIILCLIGAFIMMDISANQNQASYGRNHLIYLAVSFGCAALVFKFGNISKKRWLAWGMIWFSLGLLILVLIMGVTTKGGTRALRLFGLSFQPSFLARMALIFLFADHFAKKHEELQVIELKKLWNSFYPLIVITLIFYVLIYMERHLSTIIISAVTLITLTIFAGTRMRYVLAVLLIGAVAVVGILTYGAKFRSDRIEAFKSYSLFIKADAEAGNQADYNVKESITALSRGGFFGTGVDHGRAKHSYLPEARTDYIYTIIGEEFGFMGAFIVFFLHCVIFFRAFSIANRQEDLYLKFLCAGLAMNIFYNVLVNTGVAMSIIPSTGNTLPFISYGGSALLIDSISVGIMLSISAKRKEL